jgi:hypothetical protein
MRTDMRPIRDRVHASRGLGRRDLLVVAGLVVAELVGPDGRVKARSVSRNLVTATGNQYYAGRAALSTSLPAQVTGMKLGTDDTAPATTGGGAALGAYLSGSDHAIDGSFPTATGGVVTWKATYAAGEASSDDPITEVVLVTDTLADSTSDAAHTISRALLTGIASKGADDSLAITWTHTLLGS